MGDFKKAVKFVLDHEGGYVNNPSDPGGETKYGISKRAYPREDIKNLTESQAVEIYRLDYWNPSGAELLRDDMAVLHFDTAVNVGVEKAKEILSKSGNENFEKYLWIRLMHYVAICRRNPKLREFLLGWCNRLIDIYKACNV